MKPLRFGLVGENIGYTKSPEIFAVMLAQLKLNGSFDAHSVSAQQLGACVRQMVESGFSGFAVTIPHKDNIGEYLDSVDESATAVGAVNSVGIRNGSLTGYNTDRYGFTFSLRRRDFSGCKQALILGTGGAARAVMAALRYDFGVTRFVMCGRWSGDAGRPTIETRRLRDLLQADVSAISFDECVRDPGCDLVVNCTPLGGPNHIDERAVPDGFGWGPAENYYDLNYNADNLMLIEAARHGVATMDGSAMLVAQAVRSLELWTGHKADFEPVYREVFPGR